MTKWEYKMITWDRRSPPPMEEMNELGNEGWELVAGGRGGGDNFTVSEYVFKRPLL